MRPTDPTPIRVAGCMSGTSLDGVDVAVIETDGRELWGFGETRYRPYSEAERDTLRAALGHWPGTPEVAAAAEVVEAAHIEALTDLPHVAAIGFHGQTLAHDPDGGRTHQAGDGARLAHALGVEVIWDFRSNDMTMGGQGAPLAPFYHWALARWAGIKAPVGVLNLGGVGNLTWIDPTTPAPETPGALVAFDTGPANAPMDDLMRARQLGDFDADGARAAAGTPDPDLVAKTLAAPFFAKPAPKSLDRDAFAALLPALDPHDTDDALATLAAIAVAAVAHGIRHLPEPPTALWVTGGGRKNTALMAGLRGALAMDVMAVEALGLNGDALEAQAFAYLAARVRNGLPTSAPGTTGVPAPLGGARRTTP